MPQNKKRMSDKVKFETESLIKTSPKILYTMLSTPSGLAEWFADDVNIRNEYYTFYWNGSEEKAKLLSKRKDEFIRFIWDYNEEEYPECFFEFRIRIESLTNEVALIITDHVEEDEVDESKNLWASQVEDLKRVLGS